MTLNWNATILTYLNFLGILCAILVVTVDHAHGQRSNRWSEGDIRLVGGHSRHEGTVLIYHWSRWGAVCDDQWDIRDANVVCNELGYPGAADAPRQSRFGKGRRRVWLSGLHCRGNERHLTMCYSYGWGRYDQNKCTDYFSSAGVVCNEKQSSSSSTEQLDTTTEPQAPITITTTPARAKGTTQPPTTKTTEKPTTKTTPSPPTTTTSKTTTTTKTTTSTPTTTPTPTTTTPTPTTTTPTPTTTTPTPTTTNTTPTTTTTTTTPAPTTTKPPAPSLTEPPAYNQWIYNKEMWRYYLYYRNGSFITSRPDPRYYLQRSSSTTKSITTTTPRPARRPSDNSVYRNNPSYNTIGGDNLNDIDSLAPQEIRRHESAHSNNHLSMKEGYVQDQPIPVDADAAVDDSPTDVYEAEDAPVDEEPSKPMEPKIEAPDYPDFRLVGGRTHSGFKEGRLEVRLAGSNTWGVVCGDQWNLRAAIVVCKHFNVGHAHTVQKNDLYGGSTMDKVVAEMVCTGREERLEDCRITSSERTPGREACSRPQSVAGVICETRLPDLQPDLKSVQESAFLQDRYLYYLQCAYEENCLSSSASQLYGTPSWAYARRRLLHFSTIAKNIGTADFRPDVDRSRWEWHACHQHYHSMEAFSHYDIIDSHGNKVAEGHKASFCLEDSACDRGVHPKYNCQGFGHQGISVGCQDSYLADIDCQWIDVTDVKAGMYTLKIELNPNMKVPEISFDNNVARCNLYFNTQQARVYNCTLDSLL